MATVRKKIPFGYTASDRPITVDLSPAWAAFLATCFGSILAAMWSVGGKFEKISNDISKLQGGQVNIVNQMASNQIHMGEKLANISDALKSIDGSLKEMSSQISGLKMSSVAVDHRLIALERQLGLTAPTTSPREGMSQSKHEQRK